MYLYSVTNGATTTWECWVGLNEENGFPNEAMKSFHHYAYGSIGVWMSAVVAGIDVDPDRLRYKH